MTPSDVAGVFSRYFIVGFFVPAFFAFVFLWLGLSDDAVPERFEDYGDGAKIAILGGAALLLGLVLLGLNHYVLRLFEGYPLQRYRAKWFIEPLHSWLMNRQTARQRELEAIRDDEDRSDRERNEADLELLAHFSDRLLPTRFGNTVRAFERESRLRWGVNSISAWPRINLLLSDQEREIEADARGTVAFFVNSAGLAFVVGVALLVDLGVTRTAPEYWLWAYLVPFVVSYLNYRAAVGAVVRWGNTVKAAIDIHRLDLYERLGVRGPKTFTEERETLAPAVNRLLIYTDPIDDDLRKPIDDEAQTRRNEEEGGRG